MSGFGHETPSDSGSHYNMVHFLVRQMLGEIHTATLVQVKAVQNDLQTVDILPLVNLLDGLDNPTEHNTVFGLPFLRSQGGKNGIILDPEVDDIGLAVFASRDISSVKQNKARANPGSKRRFAMSDGIYIGGVLNAVPTNFVKFADDGITVSPDNGTTTIKLTAGQIVLSPDDGTTFIKMTPGLIQLNAASVKVNS